MSNRSEREFLGALDAWLASFSSAHTQAAYRRDLVVFHSWLAHREVTVQRASTDDVQQFGDDRLRDGESAATVQRRLSSVSSFYRHAGPAFAAVNPAVATVRPADAQRVDVQLSSTQAADVWRAAITLGPRTAVLIGLVLHDGMKSHEVLRLDAGDVRRTSTGWRITEPGSTSPIDVDPRTGAALAAHLGRRRTGPLLSGENPTRASARLTRHGVDYLVKLVGRDAGLSAPLTVNVLRNTHAALSWSPRRESNP